MVSALCGEKDYDQDADFSLLSGKTIGIIALCGEGRAARDMPEPEVKRPCFIITRS